MEVAAHKTAAGFAAQVRGSDLGSVIHSWHSYPRFEGLSPAQAELR